MRKRFSFLAATLLLTFLFLRPATAQSLTTAEDVLKANIEATGGEAAWNAVKDMYTEIEIVASTPMGSLTLGMKSWSIFPGYGFTEMSLLDGPAGIPAEAVAMKAYYTPLEGWIEQGGQRQDMAAVNPQMRAQFQRQSPKAEMSLLSDADAQLTLKDSETFNDRPVYVVGATQFGVETELLVDQETLMVLGQRVSTPMGAAVTTMTGFQEVDGLTFAMGQQAESAQGSQTVTIKKVELNSGSTPADLSAKAGARKQAMPE
ncbi:MAG: hypothetical protein O3C45_10620 [Bacteroidetes bacterium]|nr:hypothetical protein [Bacteroidota bacterium]